MEAFEECRARRHAPCALVPPCPQTTKDNARLIVSQIVIAALGSLKMFLSPHHRKLRPLELHANPQAAAEVAA